MVSLVLRGFVYIFLCDNFYLQTGNVRIPFCMKMVYSVHYCTFSIILMAFLSIKNVCSSVAFAASHAISLVKRKEGVLCYHLCFFVSDFPNSSLCKKNTVESFFLSFV